MKGGRLEVPFVPFRRFALVAFVLVFLLSLLSSCSPGEAGGGVPTGSLGGSCESSPLPQFNVAGVTYVAHQTTDVVAKSELGEVLGTQIGDIPLELLRCENVTLRAGQGSLGQGAHVYAINGADSSKVVAAEVGTEYLKLYAP